MTLTSTESAVTEGKRDTFPRFPRVGRLKSPVTLSEALPEQLASNDIKRDNVRHGIGRLSGPLVAPPLTIDEGEIKRPPAAWTAPSAWDVPEGP